MKSVVSSVFKKIGKPFAKKTLEYGISQAGDKFGEKAAEKSGDVIMKKLASIQEKPPPPPQKKKKKHKTEYSSQKRIHRYDT